MEIIMVIHSEYCKTGLIVQSSSVEYKIMGILMWHDYYCWLSMGISGVINSYAFKNI